MTKNQKTIAVVGGIALLLYFLMKRKGAEKSLEEGEYVEGEEGGIGDGGFGGGSPIGVGVGAGITPPVTIVNNPPATTQPTYVQVGENAVALRENLSVRPQQGGGSVTTISTQTAGRDGSGSSTTTTTSSGKTQPSNINPFSTDVSGSRVSLKPKFVGFDANMKMLDSLM
jgi:hypothetical protein